MGACPKLAGGEGFEPPLAESESAVLPLDDPPKKTLGQSSVLALRVLRCATSFAQTNLFAFDFAGVPRHETGFAQCRTQ